jgi:hypothetical protein
MIMMQKKSLATLAIAALSLTVNAQKKELTDEQYFKSNFKGITQPLPLFKNGLTTAILLSA